MVSDDLTVWIDGLRDRLQQGTLSGLQAVDIGHGEWFQDAERGSQIWMTSNVNSSLYPRTHSCWSTHVDCSKDVRWVRGQIG